jgi:hypothetical protein
MISLVIKSESNMKKIILALSALAVFGLSSCGPNPSATSPCSPTHSATGFSVQLKSSQQSVGQYKLTICSNTRFPGAVYTVYGFQTSSEISNVNPSVHNRLSHVADANQVGSSVEISFRSDDLYFAIFEDRPSGSGFVWETKSEMLRGQL